MSAQDKPTTAIAYSYMPGLVGSAGVNLIPEGANIEHALSTAMEGTLNNSAISCLWIKNQAVSPVLALDNAKQIFDHINYWSEGKPSNWFKIYIGESRPGTKYAYCLVIHPRLDRSMERFKLGWLLNHGEALDDKTQFSFLYKPLMVGSSGGSYRRVKDTITSPMTVGIIDSSFVKVDPQLLSDEKYWADMMEEVMWLEPMKVVFLDQKIPLERLEISPMPDGPALVWLYKTIQEGD